MGAPTRCSLPSLSGSFGSQLALLRCCWSSHADARWLLGQVNSDSFGDGWMIKVCITHSAVLVVALNSMPAPCF